MSDSRGPERTCVVCRRKTSKQQLLRLVLGAGGKVEVDRAQRLPGRGAYVCPRPDCVVRLKSKHLAKAWRRHLGGGVVELPEGLIQELAYLPPAGGRPKGE